MSIHQISGELLIGSKHVRGVGLSFRGINPATGQELGTVFGTADDDDVALAASLAKHAFDAYRETTPEHRAHLLEAIAAGVEDLGSALIELAAEETGLPTARLELERNRTVNQLRLFAKVVRDGNWLSAIVDSQLLQRVPPRPDLRLRKIALGPVAVFGASNFPLAFSVAGGDTAAALAAGCPVIVKAHGAHPGTSEMIGRVIQQAVAALALPEGVFSMLQGDGRTVGVALVRHPAIKAVAFTGSRQGGLALLQEATQRKVPIPVYAEMSSVNPMFLFPAALDASAEMIASGFVESLVMNSGQLCTNPGLVIAMEGDGLARFRATAIAAIQGKTAGVMLTPGIHDAYQAALEGRRLQDGVRLLARGVSSTTTNAGPAVLFEVDASVFLDNPALEEEIFGASSLIVRCRDMDEMLALAEHLDGQLTATIFIGEADHGAAVALLPTLERMAGRVIVNGYPTGVEVSHAMVHGGPFPATSDSRTTSVGATAIERFLRPVSYQNMPDSLLPAALQESNPLGLWRVRDGALGRT